MSGNDNIIVDSDFSFSDAIAGTNAPLEIIDRLSMVEVCYFSFDGLRHQGQIIINSELEDDVCEIFVLIEKLEFPIGKAIPIVAYSWQDNESMAANNTSSFNFRVIEGSTKLSLHSFGRALDVNPVQNPVIYPHDLIAPEGVIYNPQTKGAFTLANPIVQEFLKRGWHWGGNFEQPKDYHHFEKP